MARKKGTSAYAEAGVDIDEMMTSLKDVKRMVKKTAGPNVLSDIGSFGGLFASPGANMALVASADGVGTKLKVAAMANRHTTVGQDLVNHCVNDILVQGARPLFFLDYVGTARLKGQVFRDVVYGLCKACRENGCALLGGETAEMPGLYPKGEYDLVGTIIGAVEKKKIITGASIRKGDVVIGLPSTGLHTNGYSLARKIIFQTARMKVSDTFPGTRRSVADVLLAVHKSYLGVVTPVMDKLPIHGMAHITGGGVIDNMPRILPKGTAVALDLKAWKVPPVFQFIEQRGQVDAEEMYRVFNMGIGFVLIMRPDHASQAMTILKKNRAGARIIGEVTAGDRKVTLA